MRQNFWRGGAIDHEQKTRDCPQSSAELHQPSGQGDKNRWNIGSGRRWIRGMLVAILRSLFGHPFYTQGTTESPDASVNLARYPYSRYKLHHLGPINSYEHCCNHIYFLTWFTEFWWNCEIIIHHMLYDKR